MADPGSGASPAPPVAVNLVKQVDQMPITPASAEPFIPWAAGRPPADVPPGQWSAGPGQWDAGAVESGWNEHDRTAERRRDSRNGVLYIAAAMILAFGMVAASVLWLLSRSSEPGSGPTVPTTGAMASPPTHTSARPRSSQTTPSPTRSATAAPVPPVTGEQANCPQTAPTTGTWTHSVSGNRDSTSCPFAEEVRVAFNDAGGTGTRTLSVNSPVTHQTYPITCVPSATRVTCTGRDNASILVLLYP